MTENFPTSPLPLFHEWLALATASESNDPEAMSLATCTKDGKPSVRMVLLKDADEAGFKFHSNAQSHKGENLAENPYAALCFHWKTLRKQIRVEGAVVTVSDQEADDYFSTRPYARKIGAWASQQSRPLSSRAMLEEKIEELRQKYPQEANIPRPPYWVGYRVIPDRIEFWWDNPDRLHDRIVYTRTNDGKWARARLYP